MANPVGCPPRYTDPDKMQKKIDEYFEKCKGTLLTNPDGTPILTKWGQEIYIGKEPPTVTGLALALGFTSRLALINYQGKPDFVNTITRAKARVEAYAERRLYDKDGSNGAQFSLKNNFKGWKEDSLENNEALERLDKILDDLGGVI